MTGIDCILCNVLWILHLSGKTEAKNNLACRVLWNYCLGNSLFVICVYLCGCVWERKRERGTTKVFWGRQAIGLLDSQASSRMRIHLSGPLTSQSLSFQLWLPEALDCPQGPQTSFIQSPNTPQQLQSWKASLIPSFTTCVPSTRSFLSAPQFPHMSHELIRVTAVWGCCRIKPVITWKCLEQSVNIKVGAFFPLFSLQE